MEQLYQRLSDLGLIDASMNSIILEKNDDGSVLTAVNKETFAVLFADAANSPTYEKLSGFHTFIWGPALEEMSYTAEQLGYRKYFDQWKIQGIF